jgi:multimeric flavodoxin WrbA
MKVLGLLGSPRRGNTFALLSHFLEGVSSCGAETKSINLAELDIDPCTHCDACLEDGECNINDSMQALYREMKTADIIVLASPIHFMTVTAQTKLFIDRCQAIWARKYILGRAPFGDDKPRKGVFISVGGMKGQNIFDCARITVKALFASLNISYAEELLFSEIDKEGDIVHHPQALDDAFKLGASLVGTWPDLKI